MRQLTFWRLCFVSAAVLACGMSQIMAQPVDQHGPISAQQTVWSGVYSAAQAYRGEGVAETSCLGCHGAGLTGGDSGPKLVGDEFLAGWNSKSVGDLFDFILTKMPDDAPGTLKKDDVASVTAYILQINNIPAGKQELPAEHDALAQIAILAVRP